MAFTFRGGTEPPASKNTKDCAVVRVPCPQRVELMMSQHIGAPSRPIVKKGDRVLKYQLIGEAVGALGTPIHSSVSGTVAEIGERTMPDGSKVVSVIIESDGKDEALEGLKGAECPISALTSEQIIEYVKNAGISGMGGASFPSWVKLQGAVGAVEKLILNGCECEPYITANYRLMLEDPDSIIGGAKILMRALDIRACDIAIEDNKKPAIGLYTKKLEGDKMFTVREMKTKYPQGDERQLIAALYRREVPKGKLPKDVGFVVFNVETAAAVYRAVAHGIPLVERIVTVDGDCIREPKNLLAPLGCPVSQLIDFCGGLKRKPERMIQGGPMMGTARWDRDFPVAKNTSAVLVLSRHSAAHFTGGDCIRCGRCVRACPMRLLPTKLASLSKVRDYAALEGQNLFSCVECGCCTFECPAGIPIVQLIRRSKAEIKAKEASRK